MTDRDYTPLAMILQPALTNWGTYFYYAPKANWYGQDAFQAQGWNKKHDKHYDSKIHLTVLNLQDLPQVEQPEVFILDCQADGTKCNMRCGTVEIKAVDMDNAPTNALDASWPLSKGLTYSILDVLGGTESTLITNEYPLGYAMITNNLFTFCVTNELAFTNVVLDIPIRVRDTLAWFSGNPQGFDNYEYASLLTGALPDGTPLPYPNLIVPPQIAPPQFFANDYTDLVVRVYWSNKNGPIVKDASAEKFHPDGEEWLLAGIFEGEALNFNVTWADYQTNNLASTVMPLPCMFGVTSVVWNVYDTWTNALLDSQAYYQDPLPMIDTDNNGTVDVNFNLFASGYVFDTSSDRWFVDPRQPNHDYVAKVECIAYDVCGNMSTTNWYVTVHPTKEYPVITFDKLPDMLIGDTGKLTQFEHNNNPITNFWYSNNGGSIVFNGDGTFTALSSGLVYIKALVRDDNQNLGGAVTRSFNILVTKDLFRNKVIVITGNDTNDLNDVDPECYGTVIVTGPPNNPNGPWVVGTPLTLTALQTQRGIDNGGYTFLRWGILSPSYMQMKQFNPMTMGVPGGLTSNGTHVAMAIFKKTSELAVPVVDVVWGLAYSNAVLPCFKVNEKLTVPFMFDNGVAVQSEDRPGLFAQGLPPGMTFVAIDDTVGDYNGYTLAPFPPVLPPQPQNWTGFYPQYLDGTPTATGTFEVVVYATNGFWQAGHHDADGLDTNEVVSGVHYTDRDIVGKFTIVVMDQEFPMPDPWALKDPLTPAKVTKLYEDGFAACMTRMPDVTIYSDTECTLELLGLPEGMGFTYSTNPVELNARECHLDKYTFSDLMLTGTPVLAQTYLLTLNAINAKGTAEVGKFEFIVNPLTVPLADEVFQTKIDCEAKVGHGYEYWFGQTHPTPFYVNVKSDNAPVTLSADNLPPGLVLTYMDGAVDACGNLCNAYYDGYQFSHLKIDGTPTAPGVYTNKLVAINSIGTSTNAITEFVITVYPQTKPVVTRAPEFVVPGAHHNFAYDYVAGLCDMLACQKMIVWSDADGVAVFARGLPDGLNFLLTDVELGDYVKDTFQGCEYGAASTFTCLKIFGTPVDADGGTYPVQIVVSNFVGETVIAAFDLNVAGLTAPVISTSPWFDLAQALSVARVGRAYNHSYAGDLTVFSNNGEPTLTVTGLPAGLTFNFAGLKVEDAPFGKNYIYSGLQIVGIPAVSGQVGVTFTLANGIGTPVSVVKQLLVKPHASLLDADTAVVPAAIPVVTPKGAKINWAYEFDIPATLPHPITVKSDIPVALSMLGLPAGLEFTCDVNKQDGDASTDNLDTYTFTNLKIAGKPTESGPAFQLTLQAGNGHQVVVLQNEIPFAVNVAVQNAPVPEAFAFGPLPNGPNHKPYAFDITGSVVADSDAAPVTLTVSPSWLTLSYDNDGGVADGEYNKQYTFTNLKLSGTPPVTEVGPYTVSIRAVNSIGSALVAEAPLTIDAPLAPIVKRAPEFAAQVAHVDYAFEYVAGNCETLDCQKLIVWTDAEGLGVVAKGLPEGLSFALTDVSTAPDAVYGNDSTFTCLKIFGTPKVAGLSDVSIVATNLVGETTIATFQIDVKGKTVPGFMTAPWFDQPLAVGRIGRAYDYTFAGDLTVFSNDGAPTLTVTGLPAGLTFNFAGLKVEDAAFGKNYIYSGLQIVGIPTVPGTFEVTFTAANGSGISFKKFQLTIKNHAAPTDAPTFVTVAPAAKINWAYAFDFVLPHHPVTVKSDLPVVLEVAGLPTGVTFTYDVSKTVGDATTDNVDTYTFSNLKLAGTPTQSGIFNCTLQASNCIDPVAVMSAFTLEVLAQNVPEITTGIAVGDLCVGRVDRPYSSDLPGTLVVKSDAEPVVLSVEPTWLSISPSTVAGVDNGVYFKSYTFSGLKLTGTPPAEGTFPVTVKVSNGIGAPVVVGVWTITVNAAKALPTSLTTSGSFDGWASAGWRKGIASMSVKAGTAGKFALSGKFALADQGYTFKASQSDLEQTVDDEFIITTYIMVDQQRVAITLQVLDDRVTVIGHDGADVLASGLNIEMFRNIWGTAPAAGYYTVALPSLDGVAGSGYLALTVSANGLIKVAGKLADGTARSFSTVLLQANDQYFAVLYSAPTQYKGGYFFGVVEFVKNDANIWIVRLFEPTAEELAAITIGTGCVDGPAVPLVVMPAGAVIWVNNSPMATANYNDATDYAAFTDYQDGINHGFVRALDVTGGKYSPTVALTDYYVNDVPEVADLLYTYKSGTCSTCYDARWAQAAFWNAGGLLLDAQGDKYVVAKAETPKKTPDAQVWPNQPSFDFYTYGNVNGTGLKFNFTKATGLFRGTFNVYYDPITAENETTGKVTVKHTTVKVTYQGVALQNREDMTDEFDARGYFLMPDQSSYVDAAGKVCKYKFNQSYDFSLSK